MSEYARNASGSESITERGYTKRFSLKSKGGREKERTVITHFPSSPLKAADPLLLLDRLHTKIAPTILANENAAPNILTKAATLAIGSLVSEKAGRERSVMDMLRMIDA